jgi:hypothetical protein
MFHVCTASYQLYTFNFLPLITGHSGLVGSWRRCKAITAWARTAETLSLKQNTRYIYSFHQNHRLNLNTSNCTCTSKQISHLNIFWWHHGKMPVMGWGWTLCSILFWKHQSTYMHYTRSKSDINNSTSLVSLPSSLPVFTIAFRGT